MSGRGLNPATGREYVQSAGEQLAESEQRARNAEASTNCVKTTAQTTVYLTTGCSKPFAGAVLYGALALTCAGVHIANEYFNAFEGGKVVYPNTAKSLSKGVGIVSAVCCGLSVLRGAWEHCTRPSTQSDNAREATPLQDEVEQHCVQQGRL